MAIVKLLVINHEFPPVGGGAAPVAWELCRHLAGLGHQVDVVTTRFGDLPAREERDGVTIYRTHARRRRVDRAETLEMASFLRGAAGPARQLIDAHRYDIIHAHFIIPAGYLAGRLARKTGIPLVITAHGSDVPGHNPDRFVWQHKLLLPFWRRLVKAAGCIISPSADLAAKIRRLCPSARMDVIPNGIDLSAFTPGQKQSAILLCGRMLRFKGFQHALAAIGRLQLGWPVHVVGDGEYLDELKRLAVNLKAPVTFYGWLDRNDPRFIDLFRTCGVFIFPSEMENFPTVLLEAQAAGMAIITSDIGGCREAVGDAALFVPPGDAPAIAERLRQLVEQSSLRQELSQKALDHVRQFCWETIAQRYETLFAAVIKEGIR